MGAWTLGRWANYYCNPAQRSKVLNVISLEFSSSPLRQCVARCSLLRHIVPTSLVASLARSSMAQFRSLAGCGAAVGLDRFHLAR